MGEEGVTKCLELIHRELDLTMAFCGQTDIQKVDRRILLGSEDRGAEAPVRAVRHVA
jgi:L-lactate dehydrogenase (cytochrome)